MKHTPIEETTDRAEALAFIRGQQTDPSRGTAYLGREPRHLEAELDAVNRAWLGALRVVRDDGAISGAALLDMCGTTQRAWLYGPWATDPRWDSDARLLLEDALSRTPSADLEVAGDVANTRLGALAADAGLTAGTTQHVYTLTRDRADAWAGATDTTRARRVGADDLPFIRSLHENEFEATYTSAQHLVEDPARFTIVLERDAEPIGYASGHVRPDGAGVLDFMAVAPDARGVGDGAVLLAAAVTEIFAEAILDDLHLAVEEHRAPAIACYESNGFVRTATVRSYRRP